LPTEYNNEEHSRAEFWIVKIRKDCDETVSPLEEL